MEIRLPNDPNQPDGYWHARSYQRELWEFMERGGKRAIAIWHRRSGKDEFCLHWAMWAAMRYGGNIWHMLPEASQARKAIWDAIDPHRKLKRIDVAFPHELRKNTRNSDMLIELDTPYPASYQVIGSDNFNSLVGSTPNGLIFSEYALADPLSWAYLKPILEENKGWAIFITTPRGPNHAQRTYDAAVADDSWYAATVSAKDSGLIDEPTLARIREDYLVQYGEVVGESMFEQEYLCSFEAAVLGAVYGKEMREARESGRIGHFPYAKDRPVETWWDLGYRDSTCIWFVQRMPGGNLRAIDYYENHLAGIDHYAKVLQDKGYVYSNHLVPHDAAHGEKGTGMSLIQQAAPLGLRLQKQGQTSLEAGINATRRLISRVFFDAKGCEKGIDCLSQYRYEWNEQRNIMSPKPLHDWASHGADAFRTGAYFEPKTQKRPNFKSSLSII